MLINIKKNNIFFNSKPVSSLMRVAYIKKNEIQNFENQQNKYNVHLGDKSISRFVYTTSRYQI